ncbi:MAG: LuxR family transcriptional regulator [Hyphomicrobiales bacterium]
MQFYESTLAKLELDFLKERNLANDQSLILKIKEVLQSKFDISNFAYMGFNYPNQEEIQKYSLVSYNEAWVKRYVEKGYVHLDPCIQKGLTTIYPFDWTELNFGNNRQLKLFEEASEFGIDSKQAFTIPIRGLDGELGLFSVTLDMTDASYAKYSPNIVKQMQDFSLIFHQMFYSSVSVGHVVQSPLTPRQKEVLKWAGDGKSISDISTIMNISVHTVKHHLNDAKSSLGALSTTHACVIASKNNLLEY